MRRALLVLLTLAACKDGGASKPGGGGRRGAMEFPVEVAAVAARDVEYEIRGDGTVDVFERVQVTARVAGVVEEVSFRVGDEVEVGQLLVTIDPARYAIAARQAEAAVKLAQVSVKDAEAALARLNAAEAELAGVVSQEDLANARTKIELAKAEVDARKVAVDRARLDKRDAYVRAASAGVVQSRDASTGMYATVGTLLATLVQREPLLVRFDVDESEASQVATGAIARFTVSDDDKAWEAKITHVAEVADPRTRLVTVTAEVTSPDRASLVAGGYAQVHVPVGVHEATPVIPELAIRPSERGFLAFVVTDGVAHEVTLELGLRTADGLVEVKKGLTVGQQLVVRGSEALREGAKVRVVDPAAAARPDPKKAPGAKP